MEKWIAGLLCLVLLTGCSAEDTFETIADEWIQPVLAEKRSIVVSLPEDAAAPVSEGDGMLYQCDGYEIILQTMEGGDLDKSIRSVSGYSREDLTVMATEADGMKKYAFVWASAGEQGDCLGKAVLLDDGCYHYVVCVLADADRVEQCTEVWDILFTSMTLS